MWVCNICLREVRRFPKTVRKMRQPHWSFLKGIASRGSCKEEKIQGRKSEIVVRNKTVAARISPVIVPKPKPNFPKLARESNFHRVESDQDS